MSYGLLSACAAVNITNYCPEVLVRDKHTRILYDCPERDYRQVLVAGFGESKKKNKFFSREKIFLGHQVYCYYHDDLYSNEKSRKYYHFLIKYYVIIKIKYIHMQFVSFNQIYKIFSKLASILI